MCIRDRLYISLSYADLIASFTNSAIPVSYTHLDVYKRQVIDLKFFFRLDFEPVLQVCLYIKGILGVCVCRVLVLRKMCIRDSS